MSSASPGKEVHRAGKCALFVAVLAVFLASGKSQAAVNNICGNLHNAYGPYDYTSPEDKLQKLPIVEIAHFTEEVEEGIQGASSTVGGDLDYTLRAFPNHHRALAAMARVALRDRAIMLRGAKYPVECYFERAIRFKPTDGAVHGEYGNYLFALGKTDRAMEEFKRAITLEPNNPSINYNLGLAYFKTKDFDQALVFAKKAYSMGFPLPGLKNKLIEAGKWQEPVAAPAPPIEKDAAADSQADKSGKPAAQPADAHP